MKPANTFAKLATTVAIFFCFAAGVSAQSSPAKPAHKAKARKPASSAPAAAAPAADAAPASPDAAKPAGPRRDPFLPLVSDKKEGGAMDHLPPGKAGLVITTVRVD